MMIYLAENEDAMEAVGDAAVATAITANDIPRHAHRSFTGGCEYDESCCGAIIRNSESLYGTTGAIPSDTLIYRATEIFAALADSTRFKILSSLAAGELCVHELVEICEVSQSAVSHQLRLLRDRDLVSSRRDGQKVVYRFSDDHVRSLILIGLEHAAEREA
ncbi:MAG: metalloregulator ArsR/SmtB family transcription factor [Coriobacteriales bacterium]|jgi:ArsR family transcriptional regulator|nr:metalloregulator ArsR/SmtB family transcription factor [Coriobacteriales bacterium]